MFLSELFFTHFDARPEQNNYLCGDADQKNAPSDLAESDNKCGGEDRPNEQRNEHEYQIASTPDAVKDEKHDEAYRNGIDVGMPR